MRGWLWLSLMPGGCWRSPGVFLLRFPAEGVREEWSKAREGSLVSENACAEVLGWMGREQGGVRSLRQPGQATCVSWDMRCCTASRCEGGKIQNFSSANYC